VGERVHPVGAMAVTSYDGSFSFKQDSLARLGHREESKMTGEQWQNFQNSPFMQGMRKTEDRCWQLTSERDVKRQKTDPAFKPQDSDFSAPKAHSYDKSVDYYKVLGIDEFATLEEVKKAYKKLSLVYHPDKSTGLSQEQKDEYAGIFIELKNAYLTLNDQATRRQYDKDRDKDLAAFEINGFKPKKRAQFDAREILEKLQENAKPDGKKIDVEIKCKLEKFFYGAHKGIKRNKRTKNREGGFDDIQRIYRVDIPKGAEEPHHCGFRRGGDHHVDTLPDTLTFVIRSKEHEVVRRTGDDLVLRSMVNMGTEAHTEPYLKTELPSVRGRYLLLWGQNPFFRATSTGHATLRVKVQGEGMTPKGYLRFQCKLGSAASRPIEKAATGVPSAKTGAGATASKPSSAYIKAVHMQTDASVIVQVTPEMLLSEVRAKIASLCDLPRGSTVRLLQPFRGGFTPYPDKQAVGELTEVKCAGTAWHGPTFTAAKCRQFLQEILAVASTDSFKAQLAEMSLHDPLSLLEHLLPGYGFEPTRENMKSRVKLALESVEKAKMPDAKTLRQKVEALTTPPSKPEPEPVAPPSSVVQASAQVRPPMKRFLSRHKLGPPEGWTVPGSDSEGEGGGGGGGSSGSAGGARHGEGGMCESAALQRRNKMRFKLEPTSEVELLPLGDPIILFTKPTCTIAYYTNSQQSLRAESGMIAPRPMFAISISAPSCAKRIALRDWEKLKASLVPALMLTGFHLLRAARSIMPRPISDSAAFPNAHREDRGAVDLDDLEGLPIDIGSMRQEARQERRAFRQRQAQIDRRIEASSRLVMPWKKLGDDAFRSGDYFTAITFYSRFLDEMPTDADFLEAASEAAAVISNRAACLAKVGHYEASLEDARKALELRPNWGRAYGRVGLACSSLGRGEEAVQAYIKAVECEPTPANVSACFDVVRRVRNSDKDAAHADKEKGNEALRTKELGLAVAHYTLAIAVIPPEDPEAKAREEPDIHALLRSVLYSNRAGAFCRLKRWPQAVEDARLAVAAKGDFVKARNRLGTALLGCQNVEEAYACFAKALTLEVQDAAALKGRQACVAMMPLWNSIVARKRVRDKFSIDLKRPSSSTKVYCISDLHFDHKVNEDWSHRIDDFKFQEDVLICNGNVCDTRGALVRALTTLKAKFRRVFYVPGNHELAVMPGEIHRFPDSLCKLWGMMDLCDELGVDMFPAAVAKDVFVVPLLSWYTAEFDTKDPFPDPSNKVDQHCKWPLDPDTQVWKYMLKLNNEHLARPYHGTVISCSHFLPSQALPYSTMGKSAKSMGCEEIDEQVRAIRSKSRVHIYGHSPRRHAQFDNGVLYVNHYHGEDGGENEQTGLFMVYDGTGACKREVGIEDRNRY